MLDGASDSEMTEIFPSGGSRSAEVSVIVPMRNAEPYVAQTLKSISSQFANDFEIIVVDDGSTDSSRAVVLGLSDPHVQLIDGPGRGIAACFNEGLKFARGKVIMPCDADDLFVAGRMLAQVEWLRQHPEAVAVCGRYSTITPTGKLVASLLLDQEVVQDISAELVSGVVRTSFCTYAVRKLVFETIGCCREYFETAQDIDMQLRIGEFGRVDFLPLEVYRYRLHESSITHQQPKSRRQFFERMAFSFQAERRATGRDSLQAGNPPEPPNAQNDAPSRAREQIQGMLTGRAWSELTSGHRGMAVKTALRASLAIPWSIAGWVTLVKVFASAIFSH